MQNTQPSLLSIVCIVAFIGFMIVALILALIYSRRQGKDTLQFAARLGFTPLKRPDEALLQRLRAVYQPAAVTRVSNLAKEVEGIGSLYVFDVTTSQAEYGRSNGSGSSEYRNIAIQSSDLDLPPFLLVSRMTAPGALGDTLDNLIATGASWMGFTEWQLVPPDFSLKYMLYVREDPRIERVFTDPVLSRIAAAHQFIARGQDDMLIFNTYDVRRGGKLGEQAFAEHVGQARQLYDWLRRA